MSKNDKECVDCGEVWNHHYSSRFGVTLCSSCEAKRVEFINRKVPRDVPLKGPTDLQMVDSGLRDPQKGPGAMALDTARLHAEKAKAAVKAQCPEHYEGFCAAVDSAGYVRPDVTATEALKGQAPDNIPRSELNAMPVHEALHYYRQKLLVPGEPRNPHVVITRKQGRELLKYMLQRDGIELPPYGHHIGLVRDLNVFVEEADEKALGVYDKYIVKRTDGREVKGAVYVVLDIANDERAAEAAKLFGSLCHAAGYEKFGDELMLMCSRYIRTMQDKRMGGDYGEGS